MPDSISPKSITCREYIGLAPRANKYYVLQECPIGHFEYPWSGPSPFVSLVKSNATTNISKQIKHVSTQRVAKFVAIGRPRFICLIKKKTMSVRGPTDDSSTITIPLAIFNTLRKKNRNLQL